MPGTTAAKRVALESRRDGEGWARGKREEISALFVWLVADGWCWFVLREKYCRLVVGLF
jgi:hypothetical protein